MKRTDKKTDLKAAGRPIALPIESDLLNRIQAYLGPIGDELGLLVEDFRADARAFLLETETDLIVWAAQLAKGEMTLEGFELAVRGRAAVYRMKSLTAAGLAQVRIMRLRNALVDAVVSALRKIPDA